MTSARRLEFGRRRDTDLIDILSLGNYNNGMSNKTDGKKALEAGDFITAEEKLIKALEVRPDDSELWWAMMLAKSELKNDSELAVSVKNDFARAAKSGDGVPTTPFDTVYCKNALRYATDGKRRAFIKNLYAELNAVWLAARGKKMKPPVPRERKLPDIANIFLGIEYAAIGLMVIGVWLLCFSLLMREEWALWTGFALLVVFALAAFIMMRVLKKTGVDASAPSVVLFTSIILSALALLIVGIFRGYDLISIMAGVVLAVAAAYGLYKLLARKKAFAHNRGKAENAGTRDPYELGRRAAKDKNNNRSGAKKPEKAVEDEYKDDFD